MKKTLKSANGTSFHSHTISATVNQLTAILGHPNDDSNTGDDKVNFVWELETDNGDIFTVYDWKQYRPIRRDEKINWHIGGNSAITKLAKMEIEAELLNHSPVNGSIKRVDTVPATPVSELPENFTDHLPKIIGINWPRMNDDTVCMVIDDEDSGEIMVRLEETKDEREKDFEQMFLAELVKRYNDWPDLLKASIELADEADELREHNRVLVDALELMTIDAKELLRHYDSEMNCFDERSNEYRMYRNLGADTRENINKAQTALNYLTTKK